MSTDYRFNVRNVAQKEIYDSYMGILRISPNLDSNGKMVDDPTDFLTRLGISEQDNLNVQLSSSNGDPLPVHFVPYSFLTSNIYINEGGNISRQEKNIINITTDTTLSNKVSGNTYVSKEFIARSSLHLIDSESKKQSRIAIASGCSPAVTEQKAKCDGILMYPIESPNDSTYFNNQNGLGLFDVDSDIPRDEQVEKSLLSKPLSWYNSATNDKILSPVDTDINPADVNYQEITSHRVIANNQYINHFNDNNEEIPVLYTRDYVLGHYEGHTQSTDKEKREALKTTFLPTNSKINEITDYNKITKLSWIRFDNLVWECLDEVLSGKLRHVNGRYKDLGTGVSNITGGETNQKSNSIETKLFGDNNDYNEYKATNLYENEPQSLWVDYTAPLVGKGVQEGMIMYHAMPFHRYWFHRCRQVLFNMEEFKKQYEETHGEAGQSWEDMDNNERTELNNCFNNDAITPCCKASITPHHSLVKDFLLCNGKEVTLKNFPNISLNNGNLLKDTDKNGKTIDLIKGKQSTPNKDYKTFPQKQKTPEKNDWAANTTYYALQASSPSSDGKYIKLPNLFNFNEKYPRFIRGLNWTTPTDDVENFNSATNPDSNLKVNNNYNMAYTDANDINNQTNIWGNKGKSIIKNLQDVSKPYYFSFDYLTRKQKHKHRLFAQAAGTRNAYNSSLLADYPHTDSYEEGDIRVKSDNATISTKPHMQPILTTYTHNMDWLNYNFLNQTYYNNFQPIHTAGLFYFNNSFTPGVTNPNLINEYWFYYDAKGIPHSLSAAWIKPRNNPNFPTFNTDYPETFDAPNEYRWLRFKRKQMIIKLNESEGITPISIVGSAGFYTKHNHKWKRKRKSGGTESEYGIFQKHDVGSYVLRGIGENSTYPSHWRSMTSLQYWDCENLGVGWIENINIDEYLRKDTIPPTATNYYNYHSVTDVWRENSTKYKEELNYGDKTLIVDTSSPYPSFMNLIPLIRI